MASIAAALSAIKSDALGCLGGAAFVNDCFRRAGRHLWLLAGSAAKLHFPIWAFPFAFCEILPFQLDSGACSPYQATGSTFHILETGIEAVGSKWEFLYAVLFRHSIKAILESRVSFVQTAVGCIGVSGDLFAPPQSRVCTLAARIAGRSQIAERGVGVRAYHRWAVRHDQRAMELAAS